MFAKYIKLQMPFIAVCILIHVPGHAMVNCKG